MAWSKERFDVACEIMRASKTVAEGARKLSLGERSLREAFAARGVKPSDYVNRPGAPEPEPAQPPEPIDPVTLHRERKAQKLERDERAELLKRLDISEKRFDFWADVHASPMPPAIPRREFGSGLREGCAIALLSDAHIEEYVEAAKVAERNEYNLEISERRMQRFFAGVAWLIKFNRCAWAIRDLILWLGGDLLTGYIHDELIESNLLSPVEAVLVLRQRLRSGINQLLEDNELERITIPCNFGNHGRLGQKRKIKTGAENSFEWLLYNVLAEDYANEPRVRFEIPRGGHTYVQAFNQILHFHHGDEVTYYGGIGGLTIPLGKRVPKWDNVKRADLHHIGHFHQFTDLGHTIVNGSVIGYSEYAFSIGADFEPPQQAFYLLDSKRGKCNVTPIWVDEGETVIS